MSGIAASLAVANKAEVVDGDGAVVLELGERVGNRHLPEEAELRRPDRVLDLEVLDRQRGELVNDRLDGTGEQDQAPDWDQRGHSSSPRAFSRFSSVF